MAILRVATLGHPVLRQVAQPLTPEEVRSPAIQQLIADMRETMADYDGVGLAAPQVHQSVRLVILEQSGQEMVLINPVITPRSEDLLRSFEGCLSVPGMRAAVDRCAHVEVAALDEHGTPIHFEATKFNAIVVQHECDHLDGVLYIDRCDTRTLATLENFRKHGPLDPDFADDDDDEGEE